MCALPIYPAVWSRSARPGCCRLAAPAPAGCSPSARRRAAPSWSSIAPSVPQRRRSRRTLRAGSIPRATPRRTACARRRRPPRRARAASSRLRRGRSGGCGNRYSRRNQPRHIVPLAEHLVMIEQNRDAGGIAFGTIRRAGAVSVFGNDDRLAGKRMPDLIEGSSEVVGRPLMPGSEVFVAHHVIHHAGGVFLGRREQRVGSVRDQPFRVELLRLLIKTFGERVGRRILAVGFVAHAPRENAWVVAVAGENMQNLKGEF